jgi:hypothetical protein
LPQKKRQVFLFVCGQFVLARSGRGVLYINKIKIKKSKFKILKTRIKSRKLLLGAGCIAALALITYAIVKGQSQVTDTFSDESKIASKTNITLTSGQIKLFNCGDPVTFTYKGSQVTYYSTSSLGECWLDRNLGASQVATAYNDSSAYGDLFQWGRLDDGHQTRTSASTTATTSNDVPGHSNFIINASSPYDWHIPQKDTLWQGVSGINNPCPSGWRLPTITEWSTEESSWAQQNYNGAYASPLKLTAGGYRFNSSANLINVGTYGFYWSSTVGGTYAYLLLFYSSDSITNTNNRAYGFTVRCVKD